MAEKTLTDGTGRVFVSISLKTAKQTLRIANLSLAYYQGNFSGAGVLRCKQTGNITYLNDAIKTAQWTKTKPADDLI